VACCYFASALIAAMLLSVTLEYQKVVHVAALAALIDEAIP
jgi:hypothetical protein